MKTKTVMAYEKLNKKIKNMDSGTLMKKIDGLIHTLER